MRQTVRYDLGLEVRSYERVQLTLISDAIAEKHFVTVDADLEETEALRHENASAIVARNVAQSLSARH